MGEVTQPQLKEASSFKDQLKFVDLDKIHWEERYRSNDEAHINNLSESIKEKGVLQPITIAPDGRGMAGYCRWEGSRRAGLTKIPALIRNPADTVDAFEIELVENALRKNPSWDDQAEAIKKLDLLYKANKVDWSNRKTAALLGISAMTVSRAVKLADALQSFPEMRDLKDAAEAHKVLDKMEEHVVIQELRKRAEADPLNKGVKAMLTLADRSYIIGDTFKGLEGLKTNGKIDIIECDPPYGIDLSEQKRSKDNAASNVHSYNEVPAPQYDDFLKDLTKELYRVANNDAWLIFWFGPTWQHEVLVALREAGWIVDEIPCIWSKGQGQTNAPEYYLARTYEPFYLCRKGKPIMVKRGRANVFNFLGASDKYHPTQRPIDLMEELLEVLGVDLQTVLVPFLGSGVTVRAAFRLGMRAFGWDLNGEYKDRFMLSIEADAKQLTQTDG